MTPIMHHMVIHQKANLIHWAIIKPNNRCFYMLKCKYMKLQFDAQRVIPIYVEFRAESKWREKGKHHKNDPQNNSWCCRQLSCTLNTIDSDLKWRSLQHFSVFSSAATNRSFIPWNVQYNHRASYTRGHVWEDLLCYINIWLELYFIFWTQINMSSYLPFN